LKSAQRHQSSNEAPTGAPEKTNLRNLSQVSRFPVGPDARYALLELFGQSGRETIVDASRR
jgi:hypothetical protein